MLMLSRLMVKWHSLFEPREEGQGLVEYALILVLVSIVAIATLSLLGPQIRDIFGEISSHLGIETGTNGEGTEGFIQMMAWM